MFEVRLEGDVPSGRFLPVLHREGQGQFADGVDGSNRSWSLYFSWPAPSW